MSSLLGSDLRKEVIELELIYRERKKRHDIGNPVTFGWPDLLEEQQSYEDDEAFALRRRTRLRDFIENILYFTKDGKKINIHVIDGSKDFPNSMLNMIYDCFYGVKDKAILWKPRGSGGSISVSIIIFLCMVYRKISFTLIAGSEKQAKVVYNYVMQLWNCNTAMAHQMLAKSPTSTKIITVPEAGSTTLECITASEKAVRGIHTAGLVIDECSQRDASTDKVLEAALQGPMSEPEHLIMACSTFHNPSGFYQELWDFSGEKGYTQYKWDILETMRPCRKPIDCRKCFLTKAVTQYTKAGEPTGVKYKECAGRARTTTGWQTYDQVVTAKKQNIGSTVWEVEYLCSRPETGRTVYSTEKIVAAQKACPLNISGEPFVPFHPKETQLSIGVDWGLVQTAVVLLAKNPEYIGVLETKAFEGQPLTDIIRYLRQLHQKYRPGSLLSPAEKEKRRAERRLKQSGPVYVVSTGEDEFGYNEPITIWGDASHPFNNMELGQLGYVVMPVPFAQYKDLGIENLVKYFYSGRVMLPQTHELLCRQLKLYARDLKGKPVKKNDHFPDAMMCAGLAFPYIENYGDRDLATGSIPHEKNQGVDVFSI